MKDRSSHNGQDSRFWIIFTAIATVVAAVATIWSVVENKSTLEVLYKRVMADVKEFLHGERSEATNNDSESESDSTIVSKSLSPSEIHTPNQSENWKELWILEDGRGKDTLWHDPTSRDRTIILDRSNHITSKQKQDLLRKYYRMESK